MSRSVMAIFGFALAYLALGLVVQNQYYQLMLTLVLVWAIMGVSWNVFSGYSGLVSFGHASFFGLGAYTVTLLFVHAGITPWIGVPAGMLVGAAAGVVIGYPTFRLRGVYFALAMLAYPLALLYIFEWLGYQEVPLPMKRESPATYM
ncbi:MAG: branched-chain amino acid ABC transporter permease, partial [Burkholderiales bacterium]